MLRSLSCKESDTTERLNNNNRYHCGKLKLSLKKKIIFELAGSSVLCSVFSSCGEQGLLSSCSAWASHCGGFSGCRAQALGYSGFSSCDAQAQQLQLRGSRAQAQ